MTSPITIPSRSYAPTNDSSKTEVANYLLDNVGLWIDTAHFEMVGGISGPRRMRELRENGWQIVSRRDPAGNTRQHRLVKAPTKAIQSKYRTVTKVATSA